jgi:hypothetical protein
MLTWLVLAENVSPAVSVTEKDPPTGQQLHPTTITSEGFSVDRVTEQEPTYPHPFLALPSREGGFVDVVELVEVVVVDVELVVVEELGCIASAMTPKSDPCEVPNDRVAEDSGL